MKNIHEETNKMMLSSRRNTILSIESIINNSILNESQKVEIISKYIDIYTIVNRAEYNHLNSQL